MANVRSRPSSAGAVGAPFVALRLLALLLGAFLLAQGLGKLAWFGDSGILAARLQNWLTNAPDPLVRWYIETVAMPGVPLFARLVPLGEMATGLALLVGFWPRLAAALACLMVLNFHLGLGTYFSLEFFTDPAALPVLGGLLAVAIGGARLPWCVRL